jgi:hypothetical protein
VLERQLTAETSSLSDLLCRYVTIDEVVLVATAS